MPHCSPVWPHPAIVGHFWESQSCQFVPCISSWLGRAERPPAPLCARKGRWCGRYARKRDTVSRAGVQMAGGPDSDPTTLDTEGCNNACCIAYCFAPSPYTSAAVDVCWCTCIYVEGWGHCSQSSKFSSGGVDTPNPLPAMCVPALLSVSLFTLIGHSRKGRLCGRRARRQRIVPNLTLF